MRGRIHAHLPSRYVELHAQHRMRRQSNLLVDKPPPPVERSPEPTAATSYVDLYGLSKRPFGGQAQGASYVLFGSHRRAFDLLVNHVLSGSGAVLLTGDEGIGKTEMLRACADMAEGHGLHVTRLFHAPDRPLTHMELADCLTHQQPTAPAQDGRRQVILIDDFDLLPPDALDLLRPHLEIKESGPALILTGASGLRRPEIAGLVGLFHNTIRLIPLSPAECQQFIERSFWIAGGTTRRLMQREAIRAVIAESGGSPGRIARLMEAALTTGFARADPRITTRTVNAAIGATSRNRSWRTRAGETALGRAIAVISVALFLGGAGLFAFEAWHDAAKVALPSPAGTRPTTDTRQTTPAVSASSSLSPELVATLLKRGQDSLALGDIAAARLLLQRAAEAGSAPAAVTLAKTYDPNEAVSQPSGVDVRRAAEWYRKAQTLGEPTAVAMLHRLGIER